MPPVIEVTKSKETKNKVVVTSSGDEINAYLSQPLFEQLKSGETIEISLAGSNGSSTDS